jgi:hypothetical protein
MTSLHSFGVTMIGSKKIVAFPVAVVLALSVTACTDRRPKETQVGPPPAVIPVSTIVLVGGRQFDGKDTIVQQMTVKGSSLYISGRPFAFARLELSPKPEAPSITFAASNTLTSTDPSVAFAPMGAWTAEYYASGAIAVKNQLAYLSGSLGLSLINLANTSRPQETARKPPHTGAGTPPSDEAYIYRAIVSNPSKPLYYGFRSQDFVYTVDTSTVAMNLVRSQAYGENGENVCCVTSATYFGGRVYVAFGNRLVLFDIDPDDGRLIPAGAYNSLHPVNVAATEKYLYVQHEPISGVATSMPRGIYVFDASGTNIDRINTGANLLRMAVSPNDDYVYANVDNKSLNIYRIQWKNNLIGFNP